MNVTVEKLRTFIQTLHVAGPGDYRSHQEFAHALLDALGTVEAQRQPLRELCSFTNALSRRDNWYEMAVLQDLYIVDHTMHFQPGFLSSWVVQSAALQGGKPPYNALIAIVHEWLTKEKRRIFLPGDLSAVPERPQPPRPEWLTFIEAEPPSGMGPPCAYFIEFLRMLDAYRDDFPLLCYQYYMACHERDLLRQNLPLLRDMHREESAADWEERWARYEEVLRGQRETCTRWCTLLNRRFEHAHTEARKLATDCVKGRAASVFLKQLKERQAGWM